MMNSPADDLEGYMLGQARLEVAELQLRVERRLESRETAARLLDTFGRGLTAVAALLGLAPVLQRELDRYVRDLDPHFDSHRTARELLTPAGAEAFQRRADRAQPANKDQFFIGGVSVERRKTPRP